MTSWEPSAIFLQRQRCVPCVSGMVPHDTFMSLHAHGVHQGFPGLPEAPGPRPQHVRMVLLMSLL